jgi:hypothetical protein
MSREELAQAMLALSAADRVELAQTLWQSLGEAEEPDGEDAEQLALRQARGRDRELASGEVVGRTHEEVMEAAHRALRCS